jgi:molybdopterin/thiamine biosynthesis adenylyltransferase
MHTEVPRQFHRNLGFLSEAEQLRLLNSKVAIAGAGGDGGELAVQLSRLGVGEIRTADPDPFEEENLNRQACCTVDTVGINKAEAVSEYIRKINPGLVTVVYAEGVTKDNVEDFVEGVDLLIDETEFTMHAIGVMLARAARERRIPNLMALNVGWGAQITSYHPKGFTLEERLGLSEHDSLGDIESANVGLEHWLAYVPPYIDLKMFNKVATGEISAPTVSPGVAIAAGVAAVQAKNHLLYGGNNRPEPIWAPSVICIDADDPRAPRIINDPVASFEQSFAAMIYRNENQRVPLTS